MNNYLYLSIAFFSLFTATYSSCHSEKEHEQIISNQHTIEFVNSIFHEQERAAKEGEKYQSNKRKFDNINSSSWGNQSSYYMPNPHNWDDDDSYTSKESDSNGQESMADVNEKTRKLIKIDLTKKPSNQEVKEEVKAAISKRRRDKFWPKKTIKISKPSKKKDDDDDDISKLFETF
jgi:hypothetical protein